MSEGQGGVQEQVDEVDRAGEGGVPVSADRTGSDGGEGVSASRDVARQVDKVPEDGKGGDAVPEDGAYDLKMPEGVGLDEEMARALMPDFKELGLLPSQAQKLVDKYIEVQSKRLETQSEKWGEVVNGWIDEARGDREIGGDKWDLSVSQGRRAVEQFGTPALREYLNASGGGNHPEMIRFMAKVGALLAEDNPAAGGRTGAGRTQEAAHILFGNDVTVKG